MNTIVGVPARSINNKMSKKQSGQPTTLKSSFIIVGSLQKLSILFISFTQAETPTTPRMPPQTAAKKTNVFADHSRSIYEHQSS